MKLLRSLWLLVVLSCSSLPKSIPVADKVQEVPPFISDMRQLTFEGRRSGEGYFSHDGRLLTFQSEREPGNPFYQIYLMDLRDGNTHRVSPGNGKATCSWIKPDTKHMLFSSTHADPKWKEKAAAEIESRNHPKQKYSWNFDEAYEIYESDLEGHHLKNLTNSPGYDAEASYSPDGKWIAFASNRAAYLQPMSDEQRALFEKDPSSMMDIYIMRSDGTQVRRLTTTPGYDGGPFFSPDGKRLTFRRFALDGQTAEVYTINTDGSDERQITHTGKMSWAPFYHPSGEYLIYASNQMGFQNFELYIVDIEGRHDPVRVTDLPGFDGLPVFTPDGNNLVWTHTNEKGESQLYRAQWDDGLARQALKLEPSVPRLKLLLGGGIRAQDSRVWLNYLASDHMEGRATGGKHELEYLKTLNAAFQEMGLQPVTPGYLQNYEFVSGVDLAPEGNMLEVQIRDVTQHPAAVGDWIPFSFSQAGHFAAAPLVFAGYGMTAPASGGQSIYDSYANLDVKDKWVVVFGGIPEEIGNERRFQLSAYSQVQHKAMMARNHGALGLVVIEDAEAPVPTMRLAFEGRSEDAGLPVLRLSAALADQLFAAAKTSRKEWTTKLSKGETGNFAFVNSSLRADIELKLRKAQAHNALALLKVPGATSTVVVGAHGDHLGRGEIGNSLYRGPAEPVHNGADDNASGVTGVMEIARDMSEKVKAKTLKLRQNVLFAVWTGEELGLLGSNHFLSSDPMKISAYVNMDMIGRYRENLILQGVGSASEWKSVIEQVNSHDPLIVVTQDDPYLPTDSLSFYMKQIPTISFFTGPHPQYHTPADKADLINFSGLARTAEWVENLTIALASSANSLVTYRKVETAPHPNEGRSFRLYLGTIPDYSQAGRNGVVISGTSKDSPAEKAGVKAGDTIVELGGMKIKNLYDYMYCLQALKANARTAMRVLRRGEERELEITPVLRTQ